MRVALYARYSTDQQSETSAADQLAALRAHIARRGWTEVSAYSDEGISGSALATRPGVQALMRAAAAGGVDLVLTEALDRLSRGQADVARLFELLTWQGVRLETLSGGPVTELHIGLEGTMNRLFLVELAKKTRRGLVGRVNAGFSGGGRCYGYNIAAKGVLAVNEKEKAIVREIFERYAGGASPRAIAHDLNARGVPGPRGGTWSPSAIAGDRRAQDGILCNELYIGVRVFNRRRFRKHPETGRRSGLLNPPDQWIRKAEPALRVVDQDLWDRVHARQAAIAATPAGRTIKPKRLLSGLLRCQLCGSSMTLAGGKYCCPGHREKGVCVNTKIIRAQTVEARVLESLREHLLSPAAIATAVRAYHDDMEAARRDLERDRAPAERELAELERRIDRANDAYERGNYELDVLEARTGPLKARRAELKAALATLDAPAPIRLHPKAGSFYADLVADLATAIEGDDAAELRDLIRTTIDHVDFEPRPGLGDFNLTVHGQLATILGIAAPRCEVRVGAGTGFEPVTFRL